MRDHLQEEIEVLLNVNPLNLGEVLAVLRLSPSSPEAWYVEAVYSWMTLKHVKEKVEGST